MCARLLPLLTLILLAVPAKLAHGQWKEPDLIAGQVGFSIAASFFGKLLLQHEPPGRALKKALLEGSASGLLAHTGYCVAGKHPHLALVGKAIAMKSSHMTRRSIDGLSVFDRSLYTHWQITHSFLHLRFQGSPKIEIDVLNSAVAAYYLASDEFRLDGRRTLYSGSLFFRTDASNGLRGLSAPGVIWVDSDNYDDPSVFGHEVIHTLQNERGSALADWHYKGLRFNLLALASGVPALLRGWPAHDQRLHEREANRYVGR